MKLQWMREKCNEEKKFIKHQVRYHVLFMKKSDFNVSMNCDFIKKWSEYYTLKECEDEVNRKGHLTKPKKADFFIQNIMCYNMQRMQVTFILEEKKKHLVPHMCRMPKSIFFKKELNHTSCTVT